MLLKSYRSFRSTGFHLLSCGQDESLVIICSAFCSVGLEICRSSGGKFILFWRRGKRGRKSSFADVGFGAGGAVCKCAFSCAAGLFFLLFEIGQEISKIVCSLSKYGCMNTKNGWQFSKTGCKKTKMVCEFSIYGC